MLGRSAVLTMGVADFNNKAVCIYGILIYYCLNWGRSGCSPLAHQSVSLIPQGKMFENTYTNYLKSFEEILKKKKEKKQKKSKSLINC